MAPDWRQYLKLGNGSFAMQTMLSQLEVARHKGKIAWNSEDTIGADVAKYAQGKIARIPYDARSFGMGDVGTEDEDKVILGSLYDQAPVQVARRRGGVDYTRTKAEVKSGGGGGAAIIPEVYITMQRDYYIDDMVSPIYSLLDPIRVQQGHDIGYNFDYYLRSEYPSNEGYLYFNSGSGTASINSLVANSQNFLFYSSASNSISISSGSLMTPISSAPSGSLPLTITFSMTVNVDGTNQTQARLYIKGGLEGGAGIYILPFFPFSATRYINPSSYAHAASFGVAGRTSKIINDSNANITFNFKVVVSIV